MRTFSKSKLMALRQCPKRLWLEIHRPELREDSAATQASFNIGFQVGDIARQIYDPDGHGALVDIENEGFSQAFERTATLLKSPQTVFEAGFSANGALAFADVMRPQERDGKLVWHMVEVKSSTAVKDYHRDDVAVQSYVARSAGIPLASVALAHIDSTWIYPGDGNYCGLLKENDLTDEAFARVEEVESWIARAKEIAAAELEPVEMTGDQCWSPFECGFYDYCTRNDPKPEYPVHWLPRITSNKIKMLAEQSIIDMRDVPDELLNDRQMRVKECTSNQVVFFDRTATTEALAVYSLPAYFLDFETIQFAVPIWKGTRPYQQIPFQFSLHVLDENGSLNQIPFLDLSGNDPSEAFARALLSACGNLGPVFVYNAGFETARIRELAARFPLLSNDLLAINDRVVDLLPLAREHYYHPSQEGSWSIKKVLPAVVPELRYDTLDGVQDGGMAMTAFLEGIDASTSKERKSEIEQQLLAYCCLDTYAMVRLWQVFAGRNELRL